ncbi:acyl-coenzyme A thioesterase PaaI-like protein [Parvibaculum indicum]|uniref:PaaI family thioesterase n=1 Tax=Parvibaculum indicum TaxID=562969 RepID=UPI001420D7DA|nr:PaaI family thioesterase [Parvibaculum indicum]NIJ42937.1 acyl-coenzyme A thioesterase PaaI-like protein [Parvibaculum indicum]
MSGRKTYPSPVSRAAPEGFTPTDLGDPFEAHVGPLFERETDDGTRVAAFYVDERHLNEYGELHEGMLMTFADAYLGGAAHRATEGKSCVTLSLQASVTGTARTGDLVTCRTWVDRKTRAIVFISGSFTVGEETVMTATSLWKVLGER